MVLRATASGRQEAGRPSGRAKAAGSSASGFRLRARISVAEHSTLAPVWRSRSRPASVPGQVGHWPSRRTSPPRAGARPIRNTASSGSTGRVGSEGMLRAQGWKWSTSPSRRTSAPAAFSTGRMRAKASARSGMAERSRVMARS